MPNSTTRRIGAASRLKRIVSTAAVIAAAFTGAGLSPAAQAQSYPVKPISFIYPYTAGSSSDTAWRLIVQDASKRLGQTIVFENRPGAGGRVGVDAVLRAAPDGYTIGNFNNVLAVMLPLIDPVKQGLEAGKQYIPAVVSIETYLLLVARPSAPFRDVKGLIAYARANPGKMNAGNPGAGTGSHVGLVLLASKAGLDYTHVAYKGAAPAATALLSGEIDIMFTDLLAKPHIDAGKMVGLAVSGDRRWSLFPNLPTMAEAAGPEYGLTKHSSWQGVLAPAGTPPAVVAAINKAFNEAVVAPDVRAKLEGAGWIIKGGTTADAMSLINGDLDMYRPIIRAANIKLD